MKKHKLKIENFSMNTIEKNQMINITGGDGDIIVTNPPTIGGPITAPGSPGGAVQTPTSPLIIIVAPTPTPPTTDPNA